MRSKSIVFAGVIAALVVAATALAAPKNGGFEKGSLNGWKTKTPNGDWNVYDSTDGQVFNPPVGDFAAFVSQGDPGANFLYRDLNAKDGRYLSFYLAYNNDGAGRFETPRSFKVSGNDNQQARVDLIAKDAKLKSLKGKDILATPFRTKTDSALQQEYEIFVVDLKDANIKGRFTFRLAEVDNIGPWFVGVDEVKQSNLVP